MIEEDENGKAIIYFDARPRLAGLVIHPIKTQEIKLQDVLFLMFSDLHLDADTLKQITEAVEAQNMSQIYLIRKELEHRNKE